MAEVKSWSALTKAITKRVEATLKDDVASAVKEKYKEHIQSDVYGAYTPRHYVRRLNNGGLIADENIVDEVKNCILEVKDIAPLNESEGNRTYNSPTYLSEIIEYGKAYSGKSTFLFDLNYSYEVWANPRPFTQNTIDELNGNPSIIKNALKNGLKERGIKTE